METYTQTQQQRKQAWELHMSNRYRTKNHKQPRTQTSSALPKSEVRKLKLVWRNIIKQPVARKTEPAMCAEA